MKINAKYMNFKLLISLVFVGISCIAQAQRNHVREANEKYRNEEFCDGAAKCALAYTKIVRKTAGALRLKADMAFKTAECYRNTESPKLASEWYEKAILLKYQETDPVVYLYNGDMYLIAGDLKRSISNFEQYLAKVPGDERATIGLKSAQKRQEYIDNRGRYIVSNESKINTSGIEMAPMFGDRKNIQMVFSTTKQNGTSSDKDPRTCEGYFDLWVATLDKNGNWTEPKALQGDVNTEDNEGTVCFDGRGKTMFFTRCPNVKKQNLGCEIWKAELNGNVWGKTSKLTLKSHDSISVGHPCVSEDGKFLIFASDMPGGYGGKDLWYTIYDRRSDSWSTPANMGSGINTPGDELFPTFSKNGDLYYASNGLEGMGGLDIFKATKAGDENKWENPKNMGSPINSEYNDYALVEHTDRTGYFTSERKGSVSEFKGDIWKYELPPNLFDLTVNVGEVGDMTKKKRIPNVPVTVKLNNGTVINGTTNEQGKVFWEKKPDGSRFIPEEEDFAISLGTLGGYKENTKVEKFSTKGLMYNQSFVIDMEMVPEKVFRLPEVRYPLSKWDLLVDSTINSKDSLEYVYHLLTEYPGMVLELNSHTDSRGSDNLNRVLSDNRAKACYKYLVEEKGIDPRRIVPIGRGEDLPQTIEENGKTIKLTEAYINQFKKSNPTEFERLHQLNRRTDARVLSMEFDPDTAPAAKPEYLQFKPLPKK